MRAPQDSTGIDYSRLDVVEWHALLDSQNQAVCITAWPLSLGDGSTVRAESLLWSHGAHRSCTQLLVRDKTEAVKKLSQHERDLLSGYSK